MEPIPSGWSPLWQVDAFSSEAWGGNPAGVCVLTEAAPEAWMQAVAAEVNAAETAFLHPEGDGWRLRWFTPATEVDLCGHATLASAHVLWESGLAAGEVSFATRSGVLRASGSAGEVTLDFPAWPPGGTEALPPALAAALGAPVRWSGTAGPNWLVEVGDAGQVAGLAPDVAAIAAHTRAGGVQGVIVTAGGGDGCDFVSRYFAPAVGVDEDPVTGSAHCSLGPYWAARLGKSDLLGRQLSARGGTVRVRPAGDRVLLGGQAVTVIRGSITGP